MAGKRRKRRKKRVTPLGIALLAAFAVSLGVLGAGAYRLWNVDHTLDDGALRLRELMESGETADATETGRTDEPVYELNGYRALGILTFRGEAHTAAPIYAGTGEDVLEAGVGLAEGTGPLCGEGNAVLFGHRDSALREIRNLSEGDALRVETAAGTVDYTVARIYITEPDDPHIYDETERGTLTLVTCYPFRFVGPAPQRCVVVAKKGGAEQEPVVIRAA